MLIKNVNISKPGVVLRFKVVFVLVGVTEDLGREEVME